jgi:hypothetical protein
MSTYVTDNSLFQLITTLGLPDGIIEVNEWFSMNANARNRFVHMNINQVDYNAPNIDIKKMLHPERKYIAVVCNPWTRMIEFYNDLKNPDLNLQAVIPNYNSINLSSFENFITQLPNLQRDPSWKYWWWFTTNHYDWTHGSKFTCDYILRLEHLQDDFIPIQNFFDASWPMGLPYIPPYRDQYNDTTKNIVATIFQKDITTFGYTF